MTDQKVLLANKLRSRRIQLGITQSEVAELVKEELGKLRLTYQIVEERDITRAAIAQWESPNPRNQTVPTPLSFLALSNALKVTPQWLLDKDQPVDEPRLYSDEKNIFMNVSGLLPNETDKPIYSLLQRSANLARSKRGIEGLIAIFGGKASIENLGIGLNSTLIETMRKEKKDLQDEVKKSQFELGSLLSKLDYYKNTIGQQSAPAPKGLLDLIDIDLKREERIAKIKRFKARYDAAVNVWNSAKTQYIQEKGKEAEKEFEVILQHGILKYEADFYNKSSIVEFFTTSLEEGSGYMQKVHDRAANLLMAEKYISIRPRLVKYLILYIDAQEELIHYKEQIQMLKELYKSLEFEFHAVHYVKDLVKVLHEVF